MSKLAKNKLGCLGIKIAADGYSNIISNYSNSDRAFRSLSLGVFKIETASQAQAITKEKQKTK